jgi:hypothetical protein
MRRAQKGGDLAGNPPSSWGWVNGTLGNGWTQFINSLTLQPGQNAGTIQSNVSVPVGNINAQSAQGNIGANLKGDIPGQAGGKRRKHRRNRSRKGGSWGAVASQAAAPAFLFGMNKAFGTNKELGKSRRRR